MEKYLTWNSKRGWHNRSRPGKIVFYEAETKSGKKITRWKFQHDNIKEIEAYHKGE